MKTGPFESNLYDIDLSKNSASGKQRENKVIKILIFIILFSVALLALILIISSKADVVSNNLFSVVYMRSGQEIFHCSNGSFEIDYADGQLPQIAYDDSYMVYLSHSKNGKSSYDLFGCDLTNKRAVKKGGILVDTNVTEKVKLSPNGELLAYKKKNPFSGEIISFLYNVKKNNSKKLELNYNDIYFISDINFAFFTVKNGNLFDFYRASFGASPELLLGNVSEVKYFTHDKEQVILLETKNADNDFLNLYYIGKSGSLDLISKNAMSVLYDRYIIGGPLYYLTPSEKQDVQEQLIFDDLKADDDKIVEPNPKDYKFFFGYSYAFRKDYVAYERKVKRDELRQAIARAVSSGTYSFSGADCHAYVQDKKKNDTLVTGISPENIVSVSNVADFSAIIVKDFGFKGESKRFSEFSKLLDRRELEEVVDIVLKFLDDAGSYKGLKVFTIENPKGYDFFLDEKTLSDAEINFAPKGKSFFVSYVLTDGQKSLFEIELKSDGISQKKVLSNDISVYDFSDTAVWFIDNSGDKAGKLCRYRDSQITSVMEACSYFFCLSDDKVLALKNIKNNQTSSIADLYYIAEDSRRLIGENVDLKSLRFKGESKIAFVNDYDELYGGLMRIYIDGEVKTISDSVSKIAVF